MYDTTTAEQSYLLTIQDNEYTLAADTQTILSGQLRDYTDFAGTSFGVPYTLGDYLFVGDDTTSAGADVVLGSVRLTTSLTAVPEPSSAVFLALIAIPGLTGRRRRSALAIGLSRQNHAESICFSSKQPQTLR